MEREHQQEDVGEDRKKKRHCGEVPCHVRSRQTIVLDRDPPVDGQHHQRHHRGGDEGRHRAVAHGAEGKDKRCGEDEAVHQAANAVQPESCGKDAPEKQHGRSDADRPGAELRKKEHPGAPAIDLPAPCANERTQRDFRIRSEFGGPDGDGAGWVGARCRGELVHDAVEGG